MHPPKQPKRSSRTTSAPARLQMEKNEKTAMIRKSFHRRMKSAFTVELRAMISCCSYIKIAHIFHEFITFDLAARAAESPEGPPPTTRTWHEAKTGSCRVGSVTTYVSETSYNTTVPIKLTVAKALHGQRFPMPLISFLDVCDSVSFVVRGQRPRRGR